LTKFGSACFRKAVLRMQPRLASQAAEARHNAPGKGRLELGCLMADAPIKRGTIDPPTPLRLFVRLISQTLDGVLR